MYRKNYNIKKRISMKHFVSEFGENFSDHIKARLLELEIPCVLIRTDDIYRLNIAHVQHLQYSCDSSSEKNPEVSTKEYIYGQLMVVDGILYFSGSCTEDTKFMESPIVAQIYNSLSDNDMVIEESASGKIVDDSNIDYVIDTILTVLPAVTPEYIAMMKSIFS